MKKLILATDPYNWAVNLSTRILREPARFDLMFLYIDDANPISSCKGLCSEAIYAQRRYDIFAISKELGLKKVTNLNHQIDNIDIEKLLIQLQLHITLGGINEIWCDGSDHTVVTIIQRLKTKTYFFCYSESDLQYNTLVDFTEDEIKLKNKIIDMMIGKNTLYTNMCHNEVLRGDK